jgi:hypothetical protein
MNATLKLIVLLLFSLLTLSAAAQKDDDPFINPGPKKSGSSTEPKQDHQQNQVVNDNPSGFDKSKLRIGPNVRAGFTGQYLLLGLSSRVGYRAIKYLEPGIGLGYSYQGEKSIPPTASSPVGYYGYDAHTVNTSIYLRVYPFKELFLHVEGVMMNSWFRYKYGNQKDPYSQVTYTNVLGGIGYNVAIGQKSWFTPMLLVNLIPNKLYDNTYKLTPEINITFAL